MEVRKVGYSDVTLITPEIFIALRDYVVKQYNESYPDEESIKDNDVTEIEILYDEENGVGSNPRIRGAKAVVRRGGGF